MIIAVLSIGMACIANMSMNRYREKLTKRAIENRQAFMNEPVDEPNDLELIKESADVGIGTSLNPDIAFEPVLDILFYSSTDNVESLLKLSLNRDTQCIEATYDPNRLDEAGRVFMDYLVGEYFNMNFIDEPDGLMLVTTSMIRKLCKSGRVCDALKEHLWGELDLRLKPSEGVCISQVEEQYQECRLCGKTRTLEWIED
jgi:hypothetical protein